MRRTLTTLAVIAVLGGCSGSSTSGSTVAPSSSLPTSTAGPTGPSTSAPQQSAPSTAATTDADDTEQEPTDDALLDAFWAYDEAYSGGDPAAFYDLYSTACHDKYTRTEFSALIVVGHTFIEDFFGLTPDQVSSAEPTIDRNGESADLTYDVLGPDGKPLSDTPNEAKWIFEDGRWVRDSCDFDDILADATDSSTAGEADDIAGLGSREAPIPIGEAADVGNGWTLRINSVEIDGTAAVLAANEFNEAPPEGKQYVLINATMSYTGPDESSTEGVSIQTLGEGTNRPVADFDASSFATPPEPLLNAAATELFKGGEATGNLVIEIDSEDAPTLLILGEALFSLDNNRKFFATG